MSLSVNCRATLIVAVTATMLGALPTLAQVQEFTIVADRSEVGFEGSSTLHDFIGRTTAVSGTLHFDPRQPAADPQAHIEVRAASLDTDSSGRNKQMYKRLETERFPLITFDLESFQLSARGDGGSLAGVARGEIGIHGVRRPLAMDVTLTPVADAAWKIEGRAELDMTTFSIKPPRVLGMIKVAPKVTIFIALRAERHS